MVTSQPRSIHDSEDLFYYSSRIALLQKLGIAVFPSRLGRKGTWVKGWPTMPAKEAAQQLLKARGEINLAGRTGGGFAVIDLDAKGERDPDEVLALVRRKAEDTIIAIVRTRRGYHIWLRVTTSVGNGYCSALGGEVFSDAHLAMLPPSVHPEGHVYEWVQEPRMPVGEAGLKELGFVPDEPNFHSGLPSKLTPAAPEIQSEFLELLAEKGVARGRRTQDLVRCPWHDDLNPSLSINWQAAVFHCFAEDCLVGGGIGTLRRLLGRNTPTYRQWGNANAPVGNLGCVDDEVARLATTLASLGQADKARRLRECKATFAVGECTACGIRPVYPLSCGQPFCPRCMPGRLAASWTEHEASLPERLTLLRLRPRGLWGVDQRIVKKIRSRFSEWRKRAGVVAGLYGIRLEWGRGATVLLALPSELPIPASTRAFDVEVVADNREPGEYLRWLQDEYAQEAHGWETDGDLAILLEQTNRRRRFQGFGGSYASEKSQPSEESQEGEEGPPAATALPLSKVSGGAHSKSKKDVHLCPKCGGTVRMLGFIVGKEQAQLKDGVLQWTGPPERAGAAA